MARIAASSIPLYDACMADEINPHKRNLIAISVAHVVLFLSGGKLKGTSLLGGSITDANPEVLMNAAWVLYVYFLWMYWRNCRETWGNDSAAGEIKKLSTSFILEDLDSIRKAMTDPNIPLSPGVHLSRNWASFQIIDTTPQPNRAHSLRFNVGIVLFCKTLWKFFREGLYLPSVGVPVAVALMALLCLIKNVWDILIAVN